MDRIRRSFRDSFRRRGSKDRAAQEASKPQQWQQDEATVRAGTCNFIVKVRSSICMMRTVVGRCSKMLARLLVLEVNCLNREIFLQRLPSFCTNFPHFCLIAQNLLFL